MNQVLRTSDISDLLSVRVSNEPQGRLPHGGPIIAAGDEGGQFAFRLSKDAQKPAVDPESEARLKEMKRANEAAQKELRDLEEQLKQAEEKLKQKGK